MALRVTRQYNEVLGAGDGELRVTRQYTEVLGAGDGDLRVTRQYLEVCGLAPVVYEENVTTNMTLNQVAHVPERHMVVSHTLNLAQQTNSEYNESLTSTLNLTQAVSPTHTPSANSTLNLTQNASYQLIPQDFIPLSHTLNLTQAVEAGLYAPTSSSMNMSHVVSWIGPKYQIINTYLNLASTVNAYLGCPWAAVPISHDLDLSSTVGITYELTANSTINLSQEALKRDIGESTINFVQSVVVGKTKGVEITTLNATQNVSVTGIYQRTINQDTQIGHVLTYFIDSSCADKTYIPFIGENTLANAPSPPVSELPDPQADPTVTRFKLEYPGLGTPTDSVELRAPELDNRDVFSFNRINRETRGGKLTIFADDDWPQINSLSVTFIGLTKSEIDDLQLFFLDHLGEEILLTDWEGREWVGIITTPNEAAVDDGNRGWTISFEFEGVLIDGHLPDNRMNLTDAVSLIGEYARSITHDLDLIQTAIFTVV